MPDNIKCPQCGMVSYHPQDIENRYCGNCHQYHDEMERRTMENINPKTKKIIHDLVFAYMNKDVDCPHQFEIDALKAAHEAMPGDAFIHMALDFTRGAP